MPCGPPSPWHRPLRRPRRPRPSRGLRSVFAPCPRPPVLPLALALGPVRAPGWSPFLCLGLGLAGFVLPGAGLGRPSASALAVAFGPSARPAGSPGRARLLSGRFPPPRGRSRRFPPPPWRSGAASGSVGPLSRPLGFGGCAAAAALCSALRCRPGRAAVRGGCCSAGKRGLTSQ